MATKTVQSKKQKKAPTAVKPAAKKVSKKKTDKQPLRVAPAEQAFWVNDGTILDSLVHLEEALAAMQKAVYQYHVTDEKNDFAVWVREVLQDDACATELAAASTPAKAKVIVRRYLKKYHW